MRFLVKWQKSGETPKILKVKLIADHISEHFSGLAHIQAIVTNIHSTFARLRSILRQSSAGTFPGIED